LSEPFPAIDRRAARRNFERAAKTYAGASRLEAEVGTRMLERLDYVEGRAPSILDAGSGPPQRALGKPHPQPEVTRSTSRIGDAACRKEVSEKKNP
jgi:hypothetical protein